MSRNSKTRVVYVPGLDGTGRLLHRQPRLHDQFDVRCLSYPQDNKHTYSDLVRLARNALIESNGGIVLAESFGGAVALRLALQRPELIRRMVLVNTFAYFPRRAAIRLAAWAGRYFPAKPGHSASRPFRGVFFFSGDIPNSERDMWWDLTADVPLHTYGHRLKLIRDLDLRSRLPEIQIPTLVLAAPDDRVVPYEAGKLIARSMPNARLLLKRVGHAAMIHPSVDIAQLLDESHYWPN